MYEHKKLREIPECDTPGIDGLPAIHYDYSDRSPFDGVISGPVGKKVEGSRNPGKWFATGEDALAWAKEKYGEDRVRLIFPKLGEEGTRWAVLVKNLKR